MNKRISGLHHITALASDAQANLDFYAGILGLRLVKKTVNFDAPDVYHLYYGNKEGSPGTIMTFFPYKGLARGRKGKGQLTVTSFSIAEHSIDYWMKRLEKFTIAYNKPQERFEDEVSIYFEDNDGLGLELVANTKDSRQGFSYGHIPQEHSIKGFYGVTLAEEGYERTAGLLTGQLNHDFVREKGNRFRFSPMGTPGSLVDIVCSPDALKGFSGSGTIHHVAFATPDDNNQLQVRSRLLENRLNVTPVIDRQYFHSIYFREPGGILFEVATSLPGFAIDEKPEQLGKALKLPEWEEVNRADIERGLTPISINTEKFHD